MDAAATDLAARLAQLEGAGASLSQALREARVRVAAHRAAHARQRRMVLGTRAAALCGADAGSVRAALAAPAAAGEEAPLSLEAMHARADAALAVAARGNTVAGCLRASSGRLYRGWGAAVLSLLCWLFKVPRSEAAVEQ